jgi:hypothetical protein
VLGVPRSVAVGAAMVLAVGACGGVSATTEADPADDATTVVGTGTCSMAQVSQDAVDGVLVVVERFECQLDLSDPRVSGTETFTTTTRVADMRIGGPWTATGNVLTTDGATWRGWSRGVAELVGVLPWAEGVTPFNYGEGHYVGEGVYEGLVFHYHFTGSNGEAGVAGWIEALD